MSTASNQRCPGCFQAKGAANPCPHCGFDETAPRPVQALPLRTVLNDQFIVGRVLGKPGGFGITYLAWDRLLEATVAIKEYLPRELAVRAQDSRTLHPHSHEETDLFRYGLEQFLAEARTLAKLDHPNLVRVRQFFEANGTAYLVMDYYDGLSLAEYLEQQGGRLAEDAAVSLMLPILDGLRAVHAKGFLHRDVKPQNIYLAKTDTGGTRPILLDFGAARQAMGERSRSLSVVISAGYAPLEQYQRKGEQGPWTDVYAAAAVLYRAVTGHEPAEAIERIPDDNLLPAADFGVSAALSEVLGEALAVSPSTRPSILDFQRHLHKESASVEQPSRQNPSVAVDIPQPIRTYPKRRQVVWLLITILALSLPLLTLWQPWNQDQIDQPNPVVRDQVEPSESPAAAPPTEVEDATKSPEPPLPAATEPKTITKVEPPSPPAVEPETIVEVEPPLPSVAEPEAITEVEPSEPPADESEVVTEIEPALAPTIDVNIELLATCREHMENKRYTHPQNDNALRCYQQVLTDDPNNIEAKQAYATMTAFYRQSAEQALAVENHERVKDRIERIRKIDLNSSVAAQFEQRLSELPKPRSNVMELSEILEIFMSQKKLGWEMRADRELPIQWKTSTETSQNCPKEAKFCRKGKVRISLNGMEIGINGDNIHSPSSQKKRAEWEIILASYSDPQHFPQIAYLNPVCETVDCNFDFEDSVKNGGFNVQELCSQEEGSVNYSTYKIQRNTSVLYVVDSGSGGSGGSSNSLELLFKEPNNIRGLCAYFIANIYNQNFGIFEQYGF